MSHFVTQVNGKMRQDLVSNLMIINIVIITWIIRHVTHWALRGAALPAESTTGSIRRVRNGCAYGLEKKRVHLDGNVVAAAAAAPLGRLLLLLIQVTWWRWQSFPQPYIDDMATIIQNCNYWLIQSHRPSQRCAYRRRPLPPWEHLNSLPASS